MEGECRECRGERERIEREGVMGCVSSATTICLCLNCSETAAFGTKHGCTLCCFDCRASTNKLHD